MMTGSEANRRAEVHRGRIIRRGPEYVVYLNEWTNKEREEGEYFTDDLEDAVLTLGAMRAAKDKADATR